MIYHLGMRQLIVFIDAAARWSGGYIEHLNGILSSGGIPPDFSVFVACSAEMIKALGMVDSGVELILEKELTASPWKQHEWRLKKLPQLIKKIKADIHFNPRGLLSKNNLLGIPRVTMCRNLLPFDRSEVKRFPPFSKERYRQYFRHYTEANSFSHADGVIFLSEYSLEKLRSCGIKIGMTEVIPHGVNESFREPPRKYSLPNSPRILYVSSKYIYKHQWNVAEAIDILRKESMIDIQLDLVGSDEPYGSQILHDTIRKLENPEWLRNIGNIPHGRLADYFHRADIFVWASTVETFGIALVEAMASGLPIACSNRRPMTDILGDAGVYFDPENLRSISEAVKALLNDDEFRFKLGKMAYDRALNYSWKKCAQETFLFLQKVTNST